MDTIIQYAKHANASDEVIGWLRASKHLKNNAVSVNEYEHVVDYLVNDSPKLTRLSWNQAVIKAKLWIGALAKEGKKIKEVESDTETVLDFGDGFKIVKLVGENAYKREGALMHHCVASYYGNGAVIYSLRDKNNDPHCTIEHDRQIKGKGNGDIHPKYVDYIVRFLEWTGMAVRDSEMAHLGYINIKQFKKYLSAETLKRCYKKVYFPRSQKMIDKGGEAFLPLDLLDSQPLINSEEFDIDAAIDTTIRTTNKRLNKTGDSAKIGSSGYSAKIGSSGYSAKIGSSGYSAKIGSSGDYAQIGSSGDSAKIGSSGDYAQIGSSGDSAKIGSSGYSAKIGSSGYSAKIGSSGDSAKIGSSGDSAKIDSSGKDSVIANIGQDAQTRGKIGTWITLAEYDDTGKPLCVKSAQIDGKKLKEHVWYALKAGTFCEIG